MDTDGNEGNETQVELSGEVLRAGSKKVVEGIQLAVKGSTGSVKVRTEAGTSTRYEHSALLKLFGFWIMPL